ncbi:MAG: diaminopimelate epimerase [Actinomycetota bacterium]|nr:MAG: diaminopimelate epimerase [Actinomycetota bacterium]
MPFLKAHGTGNDFVILDDSDGRLDLTPGLVAAICDRHRGVGADGVLRVVASGADPVSAGQVAAAPYFMDYRNSDGSLAQMCGNGARVFLRYLVAAKLCPAGWIPFATRAGVLRGYVPPVGDVVVQMGRPQPGEPTAAPQVAVPGNRWPAAAVFAPNPHAVVFVDDLADAGDLRQAPRVEPSTAFPDGVNVEFVVTRGQAHLAMRVHERGSGETLSCGTGAVAATWAARRRDGASPEARWRVDVGGGTLWVTEREDGSFELAGPVSFVARGVLSPTWLAEVTG